MKTTSKSKWSNKIVKNCLIDPKTLVSNPLNWRLHPDQQKRTVDDSLREVGWISQIIVNEQTGHVVDGHLRLSLALEMDEKEVPVCYVNLTLEEEKKALLTIDPTAAMAATDYDMYDQLSQDVVTDSLWLREMIKTNGQRTSQSDGDSDDDESSNPADDRIIPEMELQPFEHYDYIVLLFRNDQDWSKACDLFELKDVAFPVPNSDKKKIGLGRVVDGAFVLKKICK